MLVNYIENFYIDMIKNLPLWYDKRLESTPKRKSIITMGNQKFKKKLERKSEIILFGTTLPHLTVLTAYLQFLICRRGAINLE